MPPAARAEAGRACPLRGGRVRPGAGNGGPGDRWAPMGGRRAAGARAGWYSHSHAPLCIPFAIVIVHCCDDRRAGSLLPLPSLPLTRPLSGGRCDTRVRRSPRRPEMVESDRGQTRPRASRFVFNTPPPSHTLPSSRLRPHRPWTPGSSRASSPARPRARTPSPARTRGPARARSHGCFVLPLILFIPDSLTYSAPLSLKGQCDRTLGPAPGNGPRARPR
jgi:hypothetical protein